MSNTESVSTASSAQLQHQDTLFSTPSDPKFNPHSINRIQAVGSDIAKTLDALDKSKTRFVK